jgi:hypothetical protein
LFECKNIFWFECSKCTSEEKCSSWKKFLEKVNYFKYGSDDEDDDYVEAYVNKCDTDILAFQLYNKDGNNKIDLIVNGYEDNDNGHDMYTISVTEDDEDKILLCLKKQFRHFHLLELYLHEICRPSECEEEKEPSECEED